MESEERREGRPDSDDNRAGGANPRGPRGAGLRRLLRRPLTRGILVGAIVGCLAVGAMVLLAPEDGRDGAEGSPGPEALARTAVAAGVPASLPDLAALITDREEHVRDHPQDAESWAVLGAAYVERGRRLADAEAYPRAERALRTSLRAGRSAQALEGMAVLANARRDYRAARGWAEAALGKDGRRWTAYGPLIEACTGLNDEKGAQRALDRLLELRSGPAVQARAAALYRDQGRREDAAAALSDAAAAARTPAERAAWLERGGQLAWERGEREAALRHFQEALRTDPDQRAAQAGQGRALAALGRTTEALSAYRTALEKRPEPQYALELGELYESLGLGQPARVQYDLLRERVRTMAAGGVDESLVLGLFEADHGDPAEAVRRLRAEWKRQPGIAVADALGWALHRAGNDEEALRFAVRATDEVHGGGVRSALYAFHRGMIERDLELSGPARRHLQEALRINPYFSPLQAPVARRALNALGEPPAVPLPEMSEDTADMEGPEGPEDPEGSQELEGSE
ncbi:tetratricopeptide repeat protein [Streptomyces sp. NPDC005017]|uniref:tetratricopeptide repeat protein n=1 Tax=Streptomyces sp. NPDC005017 TaxID=3364706 RepID=UPI003686FE3C